MAFIPFLRADVARRLPQIVNVREEQALELDSFPEFVTDIQPLHKQAIDDLALQIIRSNQTADPISEFRVEGFADIARTIPLAQRKQFEDEVSSERADNGFVLLLAALKRLGSEDFANKVARGSKAFGLGSQRLKVPNATTEAQFRKNRRVVFIVRRATVIPPPPEPAPPPKSVVEDRFSVRLIKGGSVNVGVQHVLESLTVSVTLEITDSVEKKRANFNVLATGGGFGGGPGKIGGSMTLTPGPSVRFKTFRLLGPGAPAINLKSFEGKVTVFVDFGVGIGPKSRGGTLSFSFDALEAAGANTQPTIVTVPGGNSSLTTPTIAAGDVLPLGGMTMIGEPVNL